MKSPWRIACVLLFLALAVFVGMRLGRKDAPRSAETRTSEERQVEASNVSPPFSEKRHPASMPIEAILQDLEQIEAAQSPVALAPYLRSRESEVRAAAVDALIRIGDSAAIPLLEAAAGALSEQEAAPLLEAARFLSLPDASSLPTGKAPTPRDGKKPLMTENHPRPPRPG
jgi:hypothetical protein